MKFGLGQFTLQIPPWDARDHAELYADTLALAEQADAAGFDSLWLAEHHAASDGYIPSPLTFLSAVAARTSRIELGTGVLLATYHDPLRIAEDAAVVDNLSGGRLNLGLGLGWAPEEYRMFGASRKGRGARLAEFAQVMRLAWGGEPFSFAGKHLTYEDVRITPRPARRIPIWLGGSAEAALRRAALWGDGYFPPSPVGLDALPDVAARVAAFRSEAGLDGPFSIGTFVGVGIGTDPDDGWASIRDGILHVRGSYMLWAQGPHDVAGARDVAAANEDVIRASCVCGTPKQIADRIRPVYERLFEMGFADAFLSAILVPPGVPRARGAEAIDRFAREVIPLLR